MLISIAALTEALARLNPDALILLDPPHLDEDDQFEESNRTLPYMQPEDIAAVVAEGPYPGSLVGARVRLGDYIVTAMDGGELTLEPVAVPAGSEALAAHLRAMGLESTLKKPRKRSRSAKKKSDTSRSANTKATPRRKSK